MYGKLQHMNWITSLRQAAAVICRVIRRVHTDCVHWHWGEVPNRGGGEEGARAPPRGKGCGDLAPPRRKGCGDRSASRQALVMIIILCDTKPGLRGLINHQALLQTTIWSLRKHAWICSDLIATGIRSSHRAMSKCRGIETPQGYGDTMRCQQVTCKHHRGVQVSAKTPMPHSASCTPYAMHGAWICVWLQNPGPGMV